MYYTSGLANIASAAEGCYRIQSYEDTKWHKISMKEVYCLFWLVQSNLY